MPDNSDLSDHSDHSRTSGPSSELEAIVGSRFADRYDIHRVLDQGGMGAVYKANHAYTGEEVALKILRTDVQISRMQRERFLREARAPNEIGHPGIVKVIDAGEGPGGELYLAMELLRGDNLHYRNAVQGMSPAEVLQAGITVLDILELAHAKGLVHRDIKPANIFLHRDASGQDVTKLLDFGLIQSASVTGLKTRTGAVMGTMSFMSPEQASGNNIDGRADLWSLGATLRHLLVGEAPFERLPSEEQFAALLTQEPPSIAEAWSSAPQSLVVAIDRSLCLHPDERWQSAVEMRQALRQALKAFEGQQGHVSHPTVPSEERASWVALPDGSGVRADAQFPTFVQNTADAGRRPATLIWALVGLAFLVGVGAAGWFLYAHLSEGPPRPPAMAPEMTETLTLPSAESATVLDGAAAVDAGAEREDARVEERRRVRRPRGGARRATTARPHTENSAQMDEIPGKRDAGAQHSSMNESSNTTSVTLINPQRRPPPAPEASNSMEVHRLRAECNLACSRQLAQCAQNRTGGRGCNLASFDCRRDCRTRYPH